MVRLGRSGGAARVAVAVAAAVALALVATTLTRPRTHALSLRLALSPQALAHFLADFSNEPALDPNVSAWRVVGERGNYTWWWYEVRYRCGAGCGARGRLTASDERAGAGAGAAAGAGPRGGEVLAHRLHAHHARCRSPWPLSALSAWTPLCEEEEWWGVVTAAEGGGALYRERSARRCSLLQWAVGQGGAVCAAEAFARDRERRARTLRDTLARRHLLH